MEIFFDKSLGGVNCIKKFKKENNYVSLVSLFHGLLTDTESTLEVSDVKSLKGIKPKIYEIRKKDYRIFYSLKDNKLTILDIIIKKKNYTQQVIIDRIKQRAKHTI